ncbi:MAG: hypothetical protein QXX77_04730 [Candidatus Methanosuratincola sp.]|jgi:hypothetical protein
MDTWHAKTGNLIVSLVLVFFVSLVAFVGSSHADELWVPPSKKAADEKIGNWAVSSTAGTTHFTFLIPSNFAEFKSAKVIVIPADSRSFDYVFAISIAKIGERQDNFTLGPFVATATGLEKGVLGEIDVSSLFPQGLKAGEDYISVAFVSKNSVPQVVGLRFNYLNKDEVQQEQ